MSSMVAAVRAQMFGLLARRFAQLPESVVWMLRRDGLDPIERLAQVRDREPVTRMPVPFGLRAWLVSGYDPVREVLGSLDGYSNDFGKFAGRVGLSVSSDPGGLGFADPPVHTRLRKALTPEFTMRRLDRLRPRIEAIVSQRLDAMTAVARGVRAGRLSDAADLWRDYALPVPALTICELLGVPYEDREYFQTLSTARFDMVDGASASLDAMGDSLTYLMGLIERQRREPGEGLLGSLIRTHGDAIDDRELAGLADGVLTGGLETSASMIALGTYALMTDPALRARLDHDADATIEELLRYLTVVQVAFPRVAIRDTTVAGVGIKAGDVVVCSLSGADRDPSAVGRTPDAVDPSRTLGRAHLAFGYGIHRCIGAELARMELRVAYPALFERFPGIRPAVPADELTFRRASIVFGLDSLPVRT
ncbi:cytochrome P450 [Actinoplanes solisilvae]|uniref:cytochrome P450 n=1 Tax=Actinoplanes solisilvae TaxID=2486853 RepID=UPI000FDB1CE1|nr:cytochrome P450 [Actinoplanes solisilvae]